MEQSGKVLARTALGSILERGADGATISVDGKPVARERDFLFSYDVSAQNPGHDGNGGCAVDLAVAAIVAGASAPKMAEAWAKAIAKYPLEG